MEHPSVKRVKEMLADPDHYRLEAIGWWKLYLRNRIVVQKLRSQNRALRLLLSDYMEVGSD